MGTYYSKPRTELYDFFRSIVPKVPSRVLNVGSAEGRDASFLRQWGVSYLSGVELHEAAAVIARREYDSVTVANFMDWECHDAPFYLIVMADVIEHIGDPALPLARAAALLAPGGHLLCSVPNVRHLSVWVPLVFAGRWDYTDHGILDTTHVRFFTRRSLVPTFREAGFHVTGFQSHGRVDGGSRQSTFDAAVGCGRTTLFPAILYPPSQCLAAL